MSNVVALTIKELRGYFVSPIAYVVTAGFLVLCGVFFAVILFFAREASLRYLFSNMNVLLLLIAPLLTMRLLSEEHKSGTIELLLTAPVRDYEVVIGKYLAAVLLLAVMLGLTFSYPLVLMAFGEPDWGPILSGYLGIALLGAAFLSIGLLTSSLTQNQIVAAVLSFAALLLLWISGALADFFGPEIGGVVRYLGVMEHFDDFTKGVVDLKNVIYYLSIMAASLFLTVRVLEARRWK